MKGNIVFIIGFMGSGKTTVGKRVAKSLNYDFIDTDAVIEKKVGRKISSIFEVEGEAFFRKMEAELLKELSGMQNIVVSTGGGFSSTAVNIKTIKKFGTSFYLCLNFNVLYQRVKNDKTRPLILNTKSNLMSLLKTRRQFYNQANYRIIANRSVDNVVNRIVTLYRVEKK